MRRVLLVVIAVAIAGATLAGLFLVPAVPHREAFNFSRTLPTGTARFNGQEDCGPNVTIPNAFAAGSTVTYAWTQNESGAGVNIWLVGAGIYSFEFTGGPGSGRGETGSSGGLGSVTLIFKACGPGPTVDLGFWGNASYLAPVL